MKQKCITQTQFDFAGDFFAQNHSTFRQGMPLRLWERFDFGSTFKPVRLWQRDADRRTLSAAPSGPADAPQDGPSWAKCAFWVHISLNNDLANIRLTLQRVLNSGSSQKSTKVHKKAPPGMPEALEFIRLSNRFDFRSTLPAGLHMGHAKPRRVIWRGVTCLHRAPAALGSARRRLHPRGSVRPPAYRDVSLYYHAPYYI
jgi:hypothetical protein